MRQRPSSGGGAGRPVALTRAALLDRRGIPWQGPRRRRRGTARRPASRGVRHRQRVGPAPARLRARPENALRGRRDHPGRRHPPRAHVGLAGGHRDRQQRVAQVDRGDVPRPWCSGQGAHPTPARPCRPARDAQVRLRRRPRRARAGLGPGDGGPGGGGDAGQAAAEPPRGVDREPHRAAGGSGDGTGQPAARTLRPRAGGRERRALLRPGGRGVDDRRHQGGRQGRGLAGRGGRGAGLRPARRAGQSRAVGPPQAPTPTWLRP